MIKDILIITVAILLFIFAFIYTGNSRWFEEELSVSEDYNVVCLTHHQPLSSLIKKGCNIGGIYPPLNLDGRIDLWFTGHLHLTNTNPSKYLTKIIDETTYFNVGCICNGSCFYNETPIESVVVEFFKGKKSVYVRYRDHGNNGWIEPGYFTNITYPSNKSFKAWIYSDIHTYFDKFNQSIEDTKDLGIDISFGLGDAIHLGTQISLGKTYDKIVNSIGSPEGDYYLLGNHELYINPNGWTEWSSFERNYVVQVGNIKFIGMSPIYENQYY